MTTTTIIRDSRLGTAEMRTNVSAYCDLAADYDAAFEALHAMWREEISSRLPNGCWHEPETAEILGPVEIDADEIDVAELLNDSYLSAVARMAGGEGIGVRVAELKSSMPEFADDALAAFLVSDHAEKEERYSTAYEHGQLWIVATSGAAWSVVDAEGGDSIDGFDFEQVADGDDI